MGLRRTGTGAGLLETALVRKGGDAMSERLWLLDLVAMAGRRSGCGEERTRRRWQGERLGA